MLWPLLRTVSRVATYHPAQNSLTFYSFPDPLTEQKKDILFFSLMVLTVSIQREQILSFKSSS